MGDRASSKWITCHQPKKGARLRLFCLPFAGGGASIYRTWASGLPSWVEVCPVQFPGRENRYREAPFTNLVSLAEALTVELGPFLDTPYTVFGHSMGALVGFEVARSLRRVGAPMPRAMFLSAYPEPRKALARKMIHELPKGEFVEELRRLKGTPEAALANDELLEFMLPLLRADFQACDTYVYEPQAPLAIPFFIFGATEDREVPLLSLRGWCEQTSAPCSLKKFPGDHFFIQSQQDRLLAEISVHLTAVAGEASEGGSLEPVVERYG